MQLSSVIMQKNAIKKVLVCSLLSLKYALPLNNCLNLEKNASMHTHGWKKW